MGGAIGFGAGKLLRAAEEHKDIDPTAVTLFALMLAVAVLGFVSMAGGNDILAMFVAGLAFNDRVTGSEHIPEAEIDEGLNQFLVLPVFSLFGAVLPWEGWSELRRRRHLLPRLSPCRGRHRPGDLARGESGRRLQHGRPRNDCRPGPEALRAGLPRGGEIRLAGAQ